VAATVGSTTRNTGVAHHTGIALRLTGLAVRLAGTHSPTASLERDSRLADRAEIWPVIARTV